MKTGVQLISTGIETLEFFLVNFSPINCTGLSRICKDPEVIDDMKHITLKHCQLISTEPEARLLYKILQTSLMLHNINGSIEPTKNNLEVIENINKEYLEI